MVESPEDPCAGNKPGIARQAVATIPIPSYTLAIIVDLLLRTLLSVLLRRPTWSKDRMYFWKIRCQHVCEGLHACDPWRRRSHWEHYTFEICILSTRWKSR